MKKYELTDEEKTIIVDGKEVTLHRIRAVTDFGNVKSGEEGGWIEKEDNLSQEGDAWVSGKAWVSGSARVYGNARVSGKARVYGDAWAYGKASVSGDASVSDKASVCGKARVSDDARVYGKASVSGDAWVYGDASVSGKACVCGKARVSGNAKIFSTTHFLTIGPIGSRYDYTTFYRDNSNGITVTCGCFNGTADDFLDKVEQTHGDSKRALVYRAATELAKMQIDLSGEAPSDERAETPDTKR